MTEHTSNGSKEECEYHHSPLEVGKNIRTPWPVFFPWLSSTWLFSSPLFRLLCGFFVLGRPLSSYTFSVVFSLKHPIHTSNCLFDPGSLNLTWPTQNSSPPTLQKTWPAVFPTPNSTVTAPHPQPGGHSWFLSPSNPVSCKPTDSPFRTYLVPTTSPHRQCSQPSVVTDISHPLTGIPASIMAPLQSLLNTAVTATLVTPCALSIQNRALSPHLTRSQSSAPLP